MNKKFIDNIRKINKEILKCNESLKNYNTLKLNSSAKYLIVPTSFMELKKVMVEVRRFKIDCLVIGNGSNIIFTSKVKECIIKLNFKKSIYDEVLYANELLPVKANEFCNKGYEGLEYIANIPASIGGAIFMNAGAYSHFFSDLIEFVYYLDNNLRFRVLKKNECKFGYRSSFFVNTRCIILGCKIRIIKKDKEHIKKIMEEMKRKRKNTQPIEFSNCGSIFRNKENISAWKLIEGVSLKGYRRNDAMISNKHSNFIVNVGDARAEDIIFLINLIKIKVKEVFDVELKEEVVIID